MSRQEAGRVSEVSEEEQELNFVRLWNFVTGIVISYGVFLILIPISACIAILVLSKHEKPHVPLRVFIIGQLCIYGLLLIQYFISFLLLRKVAKLMKHDITLDSASAENSIPFFAVLMGASACIMLPLSLFVLAWEIAGCVWVSRASSTRSETPILFWGCASFLIVAAIGFARSIFNRVSSCCCPKSLEY